MYVYSIHLELIGREKGVQIQCKVLNNNNKNTNRQKENNPKNIENDSPYQSSKKWNLQHKHEITDGLQCNEWQSITTGQNVSGKLFVIFNLPEILMLKLY